MSMPTEVPSVAPAEHKFEPLQGHSSQILGTSESRRGLAFGGAVFCIILVALALRPGIVSIGPLLPAIREQFNLSHSQASLLTSIPDLLMGLLALPTPWLASRFGRDRVILAALVLLTLSIAARAFAPSVVILLLTTGGVGAGIAVSGALIGGFIKGTFPQKAAVLMGVYATALGVGSALSAGISSPVANLAAGWRVGAGMWSVLGVVAIGTWLFVERQERRSGMVKMKARRFSLPFGNRKAWLIAIYFGALNLIFYACVSWIATIFRELGFSETQSGLILATYMASFIVSTPLASVVSRNLDRRRWLALWAGAVVAGLLLLAVAPAAMPYLSVILIALGIGGAFTLGMTLPLDNTNETGEANAWTAFALTVGYLIAAAGPYLVGALRDETGSFAAPVWVLVAIGIVMLITTPFLGPRTQEREP